MRFKASKNHLVAIDAVFREQTVRITWSNNGGPYMDEEPPEMRIVVITMSGEVRQANDSVNFRNFDEVCAALDIKLPQRFV